MCRNRVSRRRAAGGGGAARCAVNTHAKKIAQEALKLREAKAASEVVAVSIGPQQCQVRVRVCGGGSCGAPAKQHTKQQKNKKTKN